MYEPDTIYSPEVLHDGFSQSTLRLLFVVQGNILHITNFCENKGIKSLFWS